MSKAKLNEPIFVYDGMGFMCISPLMKPREKFKEGTSSTPKEEYLKNAVRLWIIATDDGEYLVKVEKALQKAEIQVGKYSDFFDAVDNLFGEMEKRKLTYTTHDEPSPFKTNYGTEICKSMSPVVCVSPWVQLHVDDDPSRYIISQNSQNSRKIDNEKNMIDFSVHREGFKKFKGAHPKFGGDYNLTFEEAIKSFAIRYKNERTKSGLTPKIKNLLDRPGNFL